MNEVIEQIFSKRQTLTPDGQAIDLHSEISREEGRFIYDQIAQDPNITKTLEVGCAYGLSSLHICEALKDRKDAHHMIVDPFQKTDWKAAGIHALDRAGFKHFSLIETVSEQALPALLPAHKESFDFIFIDGWHTFDHTLIDCFFATQLLKPGGILMVDDCDFGPVAKAVKYVESYPCYEVQAKLIDYPDNPVLNMMCRVGRFIPLGIDLRYRLPSKIRQLIRRPNMIALKKTTSDERPWNWYRPF